MTIQGTHHEGKHTQLLTQSLFLEGGMDSAQQLESQLAVALLWALPPSEFGEGTHIVQLSAPYWVGGRCRGAEQGLCRELRGEGVAARRTLGLLGMLPARHAACVQDRQLHRPSLAPRLRACRLR